MRLTHLVQGGGCASKLGQGQLREVLRCLPRSVDPNLLVGFDSGDDAGVYELSPGTALVQTVDFFTPIVDDAYYFGQIAAANALSDVYAMGGRPLTVLNVACFDPSIVPSEVWAEVLKGAFEKTVEAGAAVVGGHSVVDKEPKFGMAVTGIVNPAKMFANIFARPGDYIYLTKPLGTGIVTSAAKADRCSPEVLQAAISSMSALNNEAARLGIEAGVRCATDVTGFGLTGHLFNVARASGVAIELDSTALPLLPGVQTLIEEGFTTGGAARNEAFIGNALSLGQGVPRWLLDVAFDPQTSGGLALFSRAEIPGLARIGEVKAGDPVIIVA